MDPEDLRGDEPASVAIPALVEAQGGRLYALGLRFCGNASEAEDLVQETFLQAFRNWDRFRGASRPSTWLYTIASRVCQRMHRKRSGEPDRLDSLEELLPLGEPRLAVVPDERDGPLAEQVRREGREAIEAAIAGLPVDFRMPLVLKELVGFSLAEIAQILDLEEGTVKTRLHRARLKIRSALEGALPTRDVPPAAYSKQVCLDLLRAKQETLDRGVAFEFPNQLVCERCSELFATLDFASDICHDLARGELPAQVRERLALELERG